MKVKRENDRNQGETRVNGQIFTQWEHQCCVKVCYLLICVPSFLKELQNLHSFYPIGM